MSHQIVEIARSPVSVAMDRAPIGLISCEGTRLTLRNEQSVRVRPVRPADAETIQEFVRRLSITSRRLRFHMAIRELAPAMLARFTEPTGRGHVLLAEAHDGETWCMVAMAQYALGDDDGTCELALVVADAWQRVGLGRALVEMLIQSARDARCVRAVADVRRDNEAVLALGRAYDCTVVRSPYGATMLRLVRISGPCVSQQGAYCRRKRASDGLTAAFAASSAIAAAFTERTVPDHIVRRSS
jgi:GNAT superfamily N-acetyltransferase